MTDLTAYICPKTGMLFGGIEVTDACPPADTCDPATVLLRPKRTFSIDALVMPSVSCIDDLINALGGIYLTCSRPIFYDHRNNFRARAEHLAFGWANYPDDVCPACAWKGTTVTRRNLVTLTDGAFLSSVPITNNYGYVPTGDQPIHNLDQFGATNLTGPECVPGEQLRLNQNLLIGSTVKSYQVASIVFDTPAITGGRITAVDGGMTVNRTITVSVFGWGEMVLTPTDFADYQVGSWVFLLKDGACAATDVNRKSAYAVSDGYAAAGDLGGVLRLTNAERTSRGLFALTTNTQLSAAADRHAVDMAAGDFLSHAGSDGSTSYDRIDGAGYLAGLADDAGYKTGENVAVGYGSAAAVVAGWMSSPGHRANILDPLFEEIGLARAETERGKPYWVQDFGYRSDAKISATDVQGFRPAPITVNAAQNPGLVNTSAWTAKSMSLVDDFVGAFESSLHEGVIVSVDPDNKTAVVTILDFAGRTFSDVPILFHCQGSGDWEHGYQAFAPDDTVLVLNEGGGKDVPTATDLTIVGHKNALKLCQDAWTMVFVSPAGSYVFRAIDKETGAVSEKTMYHPVTSAVLEQPITPSGYTLSQLLTHNQLNVAVSQQGAGTVSVTSSIPSGLPEYRTFRVVSDPTKEYACTTRNLGTHLFTSIVLWDRPDDPCPDHPSSPLTGLRRTRSGFNEMDFKCLIPPENECETWNGVPFGIHYNAVEEHTTCLYWGGVYDESVARHEYKYDPAGSETGSPTLMNIDGLDGGFYYADGIGVGWVHMDTAEGNYFDIFFESGMPVKNPGPPVTYNYDISQLSKIISTDEVLGYFAGLVPAIYGVFKSQ